MNPELSQEIIANGPGRYLTGISSDLFVVSPDFPSRAALAMDLLSFCTECGCVVYRRDLHDRWHKDNGVKSATERMEKP